MQQFLRDETGQDMVEYGVLIATLCLAMLVGVTSFGSSINSWFEVLATKLPVS